MQQNSQAKAAPSLAGGARWTPSVLVSTASLSLLLACVLAMLRTGAPLFDPRSTPFDLLSNGTHLFGRTVVLVSFDGLRCVSPALSVILADVPLRSDYLLRGLAPHLTNISMQGIRAEYMKPIFPVSCNSTLQNIFYINLPVELSWPVCSTPFAHHAVFHVSPTSLLSY